MEIPVYLNPYFHEDFEEFKCKLSSEEHIEIVTNIAVIFDTFDTPLYENSNIGYFGYLVITSLKIYRVWFTWQREIFPWWRSRKYDRKIELVQLLAPEKYYSNLASDYVRPGIIYLRSALTEKEKQSRVIHINERSRITDALSVPYELKYTREKYILFLILGFTSDSYSFGFSFPKNYGFAFYDFDDGIKLKTLEK